MGKLRSPSMSSGERLVPTTAMVITTRTPPTANQDRMATLAVLQANTPTTLLRA